MERTLKISSKGQITLPKAVREALGTPFVRVVVNSAGEVAVKPQLEAAGALKKYAKRYVPAEEARKIAWKRVSEERVGRSRSRR